MADSRWVLVIDSGDGQDRASLAAVRALSLAGYRPAVAVAGAASLAGASRHSARWIPVPRVRDPGYLRAIRQVMDAGPFLTALPSSDAALLALNAPAARLIDKIRLARVATRAGFVVPPTTAFASTAELMSAGADLPYPVVVKPATKDGRSVHPAYRADGPGDLIAGTGEEDEVVVQPYLNDPIRAVAGIISEGRLLASVHQRYERTWPSDCGTASFAMTVPPDPEIEARLPALLGSHDGIFQVQLAGDHLIDVNPRIYGSLPLAVAAGLNLPALWCGLLRGRGVPEARVPLRARPGVYYRWIEGDLRNLAGAVRAGRISPLSALRALVPHRGAAHSTECLEDPGPAVARLRHALRQRRRGPP